MPAYLSGQDAGSVHNQHTTNTNWNALWQISGFYVGFKEVNWYKSQHKEKPVRSECMKFYKLHVV